MDLKLKKFEVFAGRPIAFLNESDARAIDVYVGDRLRVTHSGKSIIVKVDIVSGFVNKKEISLSAEVLEYLKTVRVGDKVKVSSVPKAESHSYIAKKMNGKELNKKEIHTIIKDIVDNALTEVEIAQFVVAVYRSGMTYRETVFLTEAMCKTGTVLSWHSKNVADKHCIGGIPANRTTPIVVPICASLGVIMPKTSSRAITSAAGTADVVETLCKVDFPASKLKAIVKKTNGCLAWGGSLGLAPADDKLIKVERILNLDPESQLIASILSKKLAVGSKNVLIDIPYGPKAKVSKSEAKDLRDKFLKIGNYFGLNMRIVLTRGNEPIGNGIGPVLEMIDVLKVLERNNPPKDLEKKSIFLAGQILEMMNKAPKGEGEKMALEALDSGKALKKFNEIISAQGRKRVILRPARFSHDIKSKHKGWIKEIDNKTLASLAYILGCPIDEKAGLYLHKHIGEKVIEGDKILTLYSESNYRLKEAIEVLYKKNPISISR